MCIVICTVNVCDFAFVFFCLHSYVIFLYDSNHVQDNKKSVFEYNSKSSDDPGAFLDPNHTHFLLVDNGKYK